MLVYLSSNLRWFMSLECLISVKLPVTFHSSFWCRHYKMLHLLKQLTVSSSNYLALFVLVLSYTLEILAGHLVGWAELPIDLLELKRKGGRGVGWGLRCWAQGCIWIWKMVCQPISIIFRLGCRLMLSDFVSVIYSEFCIWLQYLFQYEFVKELVHIEYLFVQMYQKKHSHRLKAAVMVLMISTKVYFFSSFAFVSYFYIIRLVTKFFSVHICLCCNIFFYDCYSMIK